MNIGKKREVRAGNLMGGMKKVNRLVWNLGLPVFPIKE